MQFSPCPIYTYMVLLLSGQIKCWLRQGGGSVGVDGLGLVPQEGYVGYQLATNKGNNTGPTRVAPGCDPEVWAVCCVGGTRQQQDSWGLLCLAFGTGLFASSEEDIQGQELCSASERSEGKQHVPNAFGPSPPSLTIRSHGGSLGPVFGHPSPSPWPSWEVGSAAAQADRERMFCGSSCLKD